MSGRVATKCRGDYREERPRGADPPSRFQAYCATAQAPRGTRVPCIDLFPRMLRREAFQISGEIRCAREDIEEL